MQQMRIRFQGDHLTKEERLNPNKGRQTIEEGINKVQAVLPDLHPLSIQEYLLSAVFVLSPEDAAILENFLHTHPEIGFCQRDYEGMVRGDNIFPSH